MILMIDRRIRIGGLAAVIAMSSLTALAQGPSSRQQLQPPPAAKGASAAREAANPGDLALRQRVEQLEEQLVDMQVLIGTLESLARGASAGAPAAKLSSGAAATLEASDAGRLDSLETQLRALAAQMEHLQEQVRALGGRNGSLAPSATFAGGDLPPPPRPDRTGFGSVTVSPDDGKADDIGRLLNPPPAVAPPPVPRVASSPPPGGYAEEQEVAPKQLYETAYGYLLQRDYGAAEAAFDDFLRRHPSDPLAGNAQYWLGESLYVRGQYRAAAGAFLKGYQNYAKSAKAPESLLKLAMSLQRLGQKDAACSSYNELTTKFPNAPGHVKTTAQAERQRAGC